MLIYQKEAVITTASFNILSTINTSKNDVLRLPFLNRRNGLRNGCRNENCYNSNDFRPNDSLIDENDNCFCVNYGFCNENRNYLNLQKTQITHPGNHHHNHYRCLHRNNLLFRQTDCLNIYSRHFQIRFCIFDQKSVSFVLRLKPD